MTVKFYLKRPTGCRESVIIARLNYNMISYRYYLLEKVHPGDWNFKTQRVRKGAKYVGSIEMNQRLKDVSAMINDAFYRYQNTHFGHPPSPKSFRDILDGVFNKCNPAKLSDGTLQTFWGFFEHLLNRMETGSRLHLLKNTPLARGTINGMRNLFNHLRAFEKERRQTIDFDSIDMNFYYSFIDYMTTIRKVNVNTVGKLITNIKVMMHEAVEFGYTANMVFTYRKFRSTCAATESVYLTPSEIIELAKLDLSNINKLERVRDLFLIGCSTGLRFSDLSQLSASAIDDNILTLTQVKTGDPIHIPLKNQVKLIMQKYNGAFPTTISNQKFNKYLKEACSMCNLLNKEVSITIFKEGKKISLTKPKYQFVSSHTARRSFATNEYLARDLQAAEIRAITGHKSDRSFYRYIRITPRDNAENVAKKWNEREKYGSLLL